MNKVSGDNMVFQGMKDRLEMMVPGLSTGKTIP
jgi:hypothetical protein